MNSLGDNVRCVPSGARSIREYRPALPLYWARAMMISCTVVVRVKSQMMRAIPSTYTRRSILTHRKLFYFEYKIRRWRRRRRRREGSKNRTHTTNFTINHWWWSSSLPPNEHREEKGKRLASEQIERRRRNKIR